MCHLNGVAGGDVHRPLNGVFQLSDISRPGIGEEQGHGLVADLQFLSLGHVVLFDKGVGEECNIISSRPKRRNVDGQDIESVIEIFPESLGCNGLFQISIGGGNNSHVDGLWIFAADADDLSCLNDSKQRDLNVQRHVADFVQKYGSSVSQFKLARISFLAGAGKGSFFVAEKFAFHEDLGRAAQLIATKGPLRRDFGCA